MDRVSEPREGNERELLLGWLAFHRNALLAKWEGLTAEQLVEASAPRSKLTLLGLVRHLTEMERVYINRALGPPGKLEYVYGDYIEGGPESGSTARPASDSALVRADRAGRPGLIVRRSHRRRTCLPAA
jgi:Protein of unknown function (DUF664)